MSEFLDSIGAAIEKQLRRPAFSSVLARFDVNAKRYWLLLELFDNSASAERCKANLDTEINTG